MLKFLHFAFLAIVALLSARMIGEASGVALWYWLVMAGIVFASVYFPFTPVAFTFHELSLEKKIKTFVKKAVLFDLIIALLGGVPLLLCVTVDQDCISGMISMAVWALGLPPLIGAQVITLVIIIVLHTIERNAITRIIGYAVILLPLVFFNLNVPLLPSSRAGENPNAYYFSKQQCDKITLSGLSETEMEQPFGCGHFNMFSEEGSVKAEYVNVYPFNAGRLCYYNEDLGGGASIVHHVDCRTKDSVNQIVTVSTSTQNLVPKEYLDRYGFTMDDSYFDVCKKILTEHLKTVRSECENQML